ncbi:MAG: hypothetical protein J4431_00985 [Candidatus Aenigmarchaeota archaeon]|nr:hypothetical protein [Candidatus Aenigmarchaeota archaeon]
MKFRKCGGQVSTTYHYCRQNCKRDAETFNKSVTEDVSSLTRLLLYRSQDVRV